jgi:hypothetical protein
LKELVDNALDACEEAGIAPTISVSVEGDQIVVADNGPGIPAETVKDVLDYEYRVSSREAYCSPTRGAQGNALKTIVAMGYALTETCGDTRVEAGGVAHSIGFRVDQIRQMPRIDHVRGTSLVRNGTRISVQWPDLARSILEDAKARFLQMAEDFAWLNPLLTLTVDWGAKRELDVAPFDPGWTKWRPTDPTSAHWYDGARFERYMAAHISRDMEHGRPDRMVREFISEFRGLSGSAKQKAVLDEVGASRKSLPAFFGADDHVNKADISALLAAMKKHTRPVNPKDLGLIGNDHLAARFDAIGVETETFRYQRDLDDVDGVPSVIECAFGWCPGLPRRRIITGANWSVAIGDPFRTVGTHGKSLGAILTDLRTKPDEPIAMVLQDHVCRSS